jgi:N,N'-diacetyllegionaminate synthase
MKSSNFVIVGAGVSGLVLGYELAKRGHKVKILERTHNVGGLAKSFQAGDYSIDSGPHLFHSAHPEIIDYWRTFVGDLLVEKEFYSGNYVDGNIYDYPINKESMHQQFSSDELDTINKQLNVSDPEKLAASKNYDDYVNNLAGPFLAGMFFKKYPSKLWGIDTNNLSARFAPRRIEIRDKRRPFHSGAGKFAGVIEGGCGLLAVKLASAFTDLGGVIEFGREINSFNSGDDVTNTIESFSFSDGATESLDNSIVISTANLAANARLHNLETSLYFRSCHSLVFVTKGADPFPKNYDWLYFGDSEVPFHRVGMQTRFSRRDVPADVHIMCCEIAYTEKPSEEKLKGWEDVCRKKLIDYGLLHDDEIISVIHDDIGPVYPGFFIGHELEVSKVNAHLGKYDNFYMLGSLAEYAYSDLQVLTAKAIDLAKELHLAESSIGSEMVKQKALKIPSKQFNFGECIISDSKEVPVFLIAEIGLCHNGSVKLCKELILTSKETGFNCAKIQTYSEGRISSKTRTSRYYEETLDQEESIASYLDRIIFSKSELTEIFQYARQIGIELFSTPFDIDSLDMLEELGVSGYKVSSMDLVNLPLITAVASKGKPVILSTGMAKMGEIEAAIEACLVQGCANIVVLHCVSSYPCPLEFANLPRISRIADSFGVLVGFSDHTVETLTPSLAIATGARVIEKHVTLDNSMDGPDHNFSLDPIDMREMVELARKTEKAFSNHQLEASKGELLAKQNLKRSIYAAKDCPSGTKLTEDLISIKSPGDGIPLKFYDLILNKVTVAALVEDCPITWEHLFKTDGDI